MSDLLTLHLQFQQFIPPALHKLPRYSLQITKRLVRDEMQTKEKMPLVKWVCIVCQSFVINLDDIDNALYFNAEFDLCDINFECLVFH